MDVVLLASLIGLALVDSTSLGTLVVPVWMLLGPGPPPVRRALLYLASIGGFYCAVGVVIWMIARLGAPVAAGILDTAVVRYVQLIVGVALFAWSFRFDSKRRRESGEVDRTHAWRERALGSDSSAGAVVVLALSAGMIELSTMLPYLAAIAMIVATGQSSAVSLVLLVGYCAVMVAPAVALLAGRIAAGDRLDGFCGRWTRSCPVTATARSAG